MVDELKKYRVKVEWKVSDVQFPYICFGGSTIDFYATSRLDAANLGIRYCNYLPKGEFIKNGIDTKPFEEDGYVTQCIGIVSIRRISL